jgi:phospholipase C
MFGNLIFGITAAIGRLSFSRGASAQKKNTRGFLRGGWKVVLAALLTAIAILPAQNAGAHSTSASNNRTATPIKHLIVITGENRSFDNVFATYVPFDQTQSVWNLLSQGIVSQFPNAAGPNVKAALQQTATDHDTYQLAPPQDAQTAFFPYLPQPSTTLNALPKDPCDLGNYEGYGDLFCSDPGLLPADQSSLSTGGTGQDFYLPWTFPYFYPVPDCRYPSDLPNAPYSIYWASSVLNNCPEYFLNVYRKPIVPVGADTTDGATTGDPVHRFFQMWQQNDCDYIHHHRPQNPSGCLHDLYTWVATSVGWQITGYVTNSPPAPGDYQATYQGGIAMGFYDMYNGDWPAFFELAQRYAISDNYHQPIMGGTGPNSQFMMTGDVFYYTAPNTGNAATPPPYMIENPDPLPGSNNYYKQAAPNIQTSRDNANADPGNTSIGGLVNCYVDQTHPAQPGVKTIQDYLASLPYRPFNNKNNNKANCAKDHFYQVDNEYPYYTHDGGTITDPNNKNVPNEFSSGPSFTIGPQKIKTIGDSLSDARISWKYYGEGFNNAAANAPSNIFYCAICNAFQYSKSIMTRKDKDGVPLKKHLQDLDSFFTDVDEGTLGAVSFIKPDTLLDGHPGTSTPLKFELFVKNIISTVQGNPSLWQDTAILITFDESGGYYDSGYIQPIDFFGDGPRTVLIAVSPYAKKGFVDHTYTDHASILKFIERNWGLEPLSARSRDNLPNPIAMPAAPYFPTNSPAIGDVMEMFQFPNPVAPAPKLDFGQF